MPPAVVESAEQNPFEVKEPICLGLGDFYEPCEGLPKEIGRFFEAISITCHDKVQASGYAIRKILFKDRPQHRRGILGQIGQPVTPTLRLQKLGKLSYDLIKRCRR